MSYKLHHGDCNDIIDELETDSIDASIIDPPYLVTDLDFDESLVFDWIKKLMRPIKPNGYLASFGLYEIQNQIRQTGWSFRFSGIWLKEKGGMRTHSAKMPMCQHEPFVVYAHPQHTISELTYNTVFRSGEPYRTIQRLSGYKRGGKDQIDRSGTDSWTEDGYIIKNNGKRQITDVVYGSSKSAMKHAERTDHPTQKPVQMLSVLVMWLTNPGDTILDCFMGSGSTGVAAISEGRNFIGIEEDAQWIPVAEERIERAMVGQMKFHDLWVEG